MVLCNPSSLSRELSDGDYMDLWHLKRRNVYYLFGQLYPLFSYLLYQHHVNVLRSMQLTNYGLQGNVISCKGGLTTESITFYD